MRMHPSDTLRMIQSEQAEQRRQSAARELTDRRPNRRLDAPPSDVIARVFGRPARSHPLRTWITLDAES
jgi:hypothetical protein